jgi:hypothetical protein
MDTIKIAIVSGIIAIGVTAVGYSLTASPVAPERPQVVGAVSSPDVQTYMNVAGPFAYGKPCYATSTIGSVGTLQADDVANTQCITFTVNQADVTLTLAASTTQFCPVQEGAVKRWFIQNASTTATADIILAGGTGVALKQATSSGITIPGDTDGMNFAVIDVKRNANSDCTAFANVYKD